MENIKNWIQHQPEFLTLYDSIFEIPKRAVGEPFG
jgi:hypothetical protein